MNGNKHKVIVTISLLEIFSPISPRLPLRSLILEIKLQIFSVSLFLIEINFLFKNNIEFVLVVSYKPECIPSFLRCTSIPYMWNNGSLDGNYQEYLFLGLSFLPIHFACGGCRFGLFSRYNHPNIAWFHQSLHVKLPIHEIFPV